MRLNLLIISILFVIIPFRVFSQNASKIIPEQIYWLADGKVIDINRAQSGIPLPEKLEIVIVLPATQKLKGQKFEFKWYRRSESGDYPLNSFIKTVENLVQGENQLILKVGRSNLKKGWVKVQIEAEIDGKLLDFENKQEFWINLM
ncbi:MAG: hypothetical protein L3J74_02315 [Bacteroidales bacterium]|nr:hypothetical protein [Bacteroidales bacterium]